MNKTIQTDILVIGSGLGGLAAAWDAAKRGCEVTLLTRASNPEDSNTYRAQGGIIYRAAAASRRNNSLRTFSPQAPGSALPKRPRC